jgi:hypothetical protein
MVMLTSIESLVGLDIVADTTTTEAAAGTCPASTSVATMAERGLEALSQFKIKCRRQEVRTSS